jgi:hypothetical protein
MSTRGAKDPALGLRLPSAAKVSPRQLCMNSGVIARHRNRTSTAPTCQSRIHSPRQPGNQLTTIALFGPCA